MRGLGKDGSTFGAGRILRRLIEMPGLSPEDGLRYWQERTAGFVLIASVFLGAIVYFPSILLAVGEKRPDVVVIDTVLLLFVGVLAFRRSLPYWVRAGGIVVLSHVLGVLLFSLLGPFGGGPIWLFAPAVLAGALGGRRPALAMVGLNALFCVAVGLYIHAHHPEHVLLAENPLIKWAVISFNFLFLNAVASLAAAEVVSGLQVSLQQEQATRASLDQEHEWLIEAHERLKRETGGRLHAESQLQRLAAAIEHTGESIFITGPGGRIQYVNPAFESTTGYSRQEAEGMPCASLASAKHDDTFYTQLWTRVASGQVWQGRMTNRRADGSHYQADSTFSPIVEPSGEISGCVAVQRDITQIAEAEQRVRQAEKMEAIGTLAGGIAHDFNNILSAILGYSQLAVYEVPPDSKAQSHLNEVMRAGDRAKELVKRILAFTRRTERELKPVALHEVARDALKLLRGGLPATIAIEQELDESVPPVWADTTEMHQVVMNLCTNAYHAMRKDGGTLTVRLSMAAVGQEQAARIRGLAAGNYACVEVADTGTGMDAATVDKIFEPFFTTKPPGEGTGMGLSTVEGIVRSCGGAIHVESTVGEGSAFLVFLRPAEQEAKEEEASALEPLVQPSPKGARVVCVDDEAAIVKVQAQQLEKLGFEVSAFESSLEALAHIESKHKTCDLLITDQTMPHMTGLQLAEAVHAFDPALPVVICTGFSEQITSDALERTGVFRCLSKPVPFTDLVYTIHGALEKDEEAPGAPPERARA